jgi:hypothetical protein
VKLIGPSSGEEGWAALSSGICSIRTRYSLRNKGPGSPAKLRNSRRQCQLSFRGLRIALGDTNRNSPSSFTAGERSTELVAS